MANKTPAPRALAAVKAGPPAEPIDKQLRITAKVRRAIDLMATGECKLIKDAAEKVGLARESLGRAFAKPHVIEHMRQRALRTLSPAVPRAAEVKAELLDSGDRMAPTTRQPSCSAWPISRPHRRRRFRSISRSRPATSST